ncbi:hypothetical protein AgCh_027926 [Apium graveolens]
MLEINPLVETLDYKLVAADTKLNFDDNAYFWQKKIFALRDPSQEDPREALDVESERIVQEALDRLMINRTTVIVAHRWSTVRNVDLIAVIHCGKMVEKGHLWCSVTRMIDFAAREEIREEVK